MKETHFFYVPDARTAVELPEEEAQHAVRVLRLKEGDEMMLMDGQGTFYQALVTMATNKRCCYQIAAVQPQKRAWNGHVHLAIAPTKMIDRMEWMSEKATEVGFDELTFLNCRFSERRMVKLPRIEKIVVSALKQSRKAYMRKLRSARSRMNTTIDRSRYVAAGTGEDWNENPYSETVVLYDDPSVSRADEIFTVNGASMEPQYYDGDKVLVEYCTDLKNGDIGIFYVPGFGGVIKQKAYDRLHSLNPDYDDIFPYEQGAKLIGRVVGKITKDMIPSAEDVSLYAEAMATLKE